MCAVFLNLLVNKNQGHVPGPAHEVLYVSSTPIQMTSKVLARGAPAPVVTPSMATSPRLAAAAAILLVGAAAVLWAASRRARKLRRMMERLTSLWTSSVEVMRIPIEHGAARPQTVFAPVRPEDAVASKSSGDVPVVFAKCPSVFALTGT